MPNTSNDDVIIVGSLSDKELRDSIDKLVDYVGDKTTIMAGKFDVAMEKMKSAMKDFAITQKVSVDLMQDAWKQMSASFDAMLKAQQNATSSGNNSGTGGGNSQYADNTVGHLQEIIALEEKRRKEMTLGSDALRDQNKLIEEQKAKLKGETTSDQVKAAQAAKKELQEAFTMPARGLADAEKKLQQLQSLSAKFQGKGILDQTQWNRLNAQIQTTQEKIDKLRQKKPTSIQDVLGMDESSVDAIAKKMAALKKVTVDPQNTAQVKQLGDEYQRLSKLQTSLLGKNAQVIRSNNYLARSFGYIRNRIVYALTLGALSKFTKQVFEVRGEYEMLERSLGVLVNSFEKGSQIFQELNEMAIKSPFTLVELGTTAKQLTAYNFAADEVVDTTRRLADISAALGVPMERLTYNLGQIKAQGVLNARDARDFANAGLAIVPMLAQMYTEQKRFGDEMVTTAQVYDMMSKKLVSYSDVLSVLYKMTDDGGKFFDYQAKQAETLKVQMNNLTLAMNNMYNEIGASNQGLLVGSVQTLKKIFENWREIARTIETVIFALGTYKAISFIATSVAPWLSLAGSIRSAKDAMALFNLTIKANPLGLTASLLASVIGYFVLFKNTVNDASHEVELFGENGTKTLKKIDTFKKILEGTSETSSTYKKTLSELSSITDEYGVQLDKENAKRSDVNSAIEQTIELVKTESAERQRANQIAKAQETYDTQSEDARKELQERLKSAMTGTNLGLFTWKSNSKELQENADAIADIVGSIVESNITLIAGKTGKEYEKGLDKIFSLIQDRMKAIGISESTVSKQWLSSALFSDTNIINKYIDKINSAKNAQDAYIEKIEQNYQIAKKATKATMSFTEKVDANARALRNNANDAISLYNRVYEIVKLAQENHVINFDLKLTAQKPPQWMQKMSLPKLQELAARFTAIAQSGGRAKGYNQEQTYERGLMYASAARQKQYEEERKALEDRNKKNNRNRSGGSKGRKNDNILDALKEEISFVKKLQSEYDKLTKSGVNSADAIAAMQDAYGSTLRLLNKDLQKFGLPRIELSNILGKNPHEILAVFTELRNILESKGLSNLERMKAVDGVIEELKVSAKTYDMKKVTDGLNSELGKIKDEYELAIELDANPELGDTFADMFGVNTSALPKTFGDALDRAQTIINRTLSEMNITTPFDLMEGNIDSFAKSTGIDKDGAVIKELVSAQKSYRDMFKKNITETEKVLDDYVKKYGDYSDKIAEIEADKLEKIKKLNDAYYTNEMRQRPEYIAKLNAIEEGARKEKSNVKFDDFKNLRYYTMIFENLDYVSTKTIRDMRDRLRDLIDSMNDLTPEQLKQVMNQYEKLEQKLVKRSPFKTLTKDLKNYLKTSGDRKAANEAFRNAQKEYDAQEKNVAALKEKYEQTKANNNTSQNYLDFLKIEINGESKILQILKEQLDAAQKKADKYNLIKKLALEELSQTATMVAENLKGLAELRDQMNELFGVDASKGETLLGHKIDGMIDGLAKASDGISKVTSSAQSSNVFGVVGGVVDVFTGIGDGIASLFGDGSARTKRINKEIAKSVETVRQLNMAYKELDAVVNNAMGAQELRARREQVANKQAQLEDLKRQMQLEKSKRSKDRNDDAIKQYQESIQDLELEIAELKKDIVSTLLGGDIKSAAESFVSTWVDAWRQGGDTMDALNEKFDDMIDNMIAKSVASYLVSKRLQKIFDEVDKLTDETSEGGPEITMNELKRLKNLIGDKSIAEQINDDLANLYGALGIAFGVNSEQEKNLSALRQGIAGVSEETASAVEAYLNGMSQQAYLRNNLLVQIRDTIMSFDMDVQLGVFSQMLLQLQNNYIVMQSMQSMMEGWTTPSGQGIRVELIS
jgi:DNA repair exonuclease SbcCD ATPase subunit